MFKKQLILHEKEMFVCQLSRLGMILEEGMSIPLVQPELHFLTGNRSTARSGLRIDLATLKEPIVFAKDWKCGDSLKPVTAHGKTITIEHVEACKVPKTKREFSVAVPMRNHEYKFYDRRDNLGCEERRKLRKRQGTTDPDGMSDMGMGMGEVPQYNTIKLEPGATHAYARISAAVYNEQFYEAADKSGLMTVGAQHGVRINKY
jgi:hypothetical protein